ncbi:MAG TPA: phosphoribosylamine--glycine ligase [Deltaproteobacteria bacterium]|nr:phosphoribosylamine--glycine ligase [Deltaproteobacteria bacterium]HIN47176.1 phosphoribosylamine--glycine ligase [Deltaproteobacteria bacterium]HIO11432.1 phosphoribosylamine--glycine ligase [Deltaproteobacteria bacterium]HIO60949.1 phosphoribosylamine--glycine ligase [Deltaproteobacteria bacterium]HIO83176.1 phosphoribosylamine--glycine ligase [Deltaproteobacteria bacterium]
MKIFVIGGGGREHALVWKLKGSDTDHKIFCAPGNPGIAEIAECVSLQAKQIDELADFAETNKIDLTVVGPEDPLTNGIVDFFEKRSLPIFGPNRQSARLEGSKAYAKKVMERFRVPTAAYRELDDFEEALAYVNEQGAPIVIKADGLAAGKGVTVAETIKEAETALRAAMVQKVFGESGTKVVIEECLRGEEMTVLAFVDGKTVLPMVPSQDHKPVFDGDRGPNTGGMGAYSPVPHLEKWLPEINERVLCPVAEGLAAEGTPYSGILYAGLMITENGPKVIEFNVRFGDPETQVILPRLENDLAEIFLAVAEKRLHEIKLLWKAGASVCVIAAAPGYPGPPTKGLPITLPQTLTAKTQIFHAGTANQNEQLVTNGGRVFGVCAQGADISEAREQAYSMIEKVHFKGKHFRSDIAAKALS